MIRLFSKVSVMFQRRDSRGAVIEHRHVRAQSFDNVPNWVMEDPIMKYCLADKSIEIFSSKEEQKQLELKGTLATESEEEVKDSTFITTSVEEETIDDSNESIEEENEEESEEEDDSAAEEEEPVSKSRRARSNRR